MKVYNVRHAHYFKKIPQAGRYHFSLYEKTMQQLIEKHDIRYKKVLSLGAHYGHEEYWFYKNGNVLTMIDIDMGHEIQRVLDSLEPHDHEMHYIIEDLNEISLIKKYLQGNTHDILYTSGLPSSLLWNIEEGLLSSVILDYITWFLKEGGFFIIQSYHGTVHLEIHEQLERFKQQCMEKGLLLCTVYHFYPTYSNTCLLIGFKGTHFQLIPHLVKKSFHQEITDFHARSLVPHEIKKMHDICNDFLFFNNTIFQ